MWTAFLIVAVISTGQMQLGRAHETFATRDLCDMFLVDAAEKTAAANADRFEGADDVIVLGECRVVGKPS